jgi:CPA2 family monovalent cation:H+ antiporter-2
LWDPEKPIYENEAYVARAKELEQELESTMLSTRADDALDDAEVEIEEGKAEG